MPDFVAAWGTIVGEPPAIMLESGCEMIRILVTGISPMPPHTEESPVPLGVAETAL